MLHLGIDIGTSTVKLTLINHSHFNTSYQPTKKKSVS